MANHHFGKGGGCPNAPDGVNESLRAAREDDSRTIVYGGGQQYWAKTASEVGVVETEDGLKFPPLTAAAGRYEAKADSAPNNG
jgi:hypothetical protein